MPPLFRHLLLTKFNARLGFSPPAQRLNDAWLRARLVPFRQFCLPSVTAQQCDFHWLVFIDADSPSWFKKLLAEVGSPLTPIYVTETLTDTVLAREVLATGLVDRPYLITTRLDSDDAIATDYLSRVQSEFRRQPREFIDFPIGLQFCRGRLFNAVWRSNPFMSLVEDASAPPTTVFCAPHDKVRSQYGVRTVWCRPQWLQVIHGSNWGSQLLQAGPRLGSQHPRFDCLWPDADKPASRAAIVMGAYANHARRAQDKIRTLRA